MKRTDKEYFSKAVSVIPGGVNSPVRAFSSVGGDPLYVEKGRGSKIRSVSGKCYIDFCLSWGPLIFGHARKEVVQAVKRAAENGLTYGINHPGEVELATLLSEAVPSLEQVRLVSSGTEATMTALRLARGATGRDKILKFAGCYHGHSDSLLVNAGSGILTHGIAGSSGVTAATAADTLVANYNNLDSVCALFEANPGKIACIIVEPVAGNMGLVPPENGFLEGLRKVCDENGALLIFDEVITGFRFCYGGFQNLCKVTPDISTFGKIVGGGMPLGAIGGKKETMKHLAPLGGVYQAGTLSGNPVAVAAGIATLKLLRKTNPYEKLAATTKELASRLQRAAGSGMFVSAMGSAFTPFFAPDPVKDLDTAKKSDTRKYGAFFRAMLEAGFYLPPAQFEAAFLSTAHTDNEVDAFALAAERYFRKEGN